MSVNDNCQCKGTTKDAVKFMGRRSVRCTVR